MNFNILETLKDSLPPSLKFLEQRVHELVGGPPQTTLWGAKGLDQEGLKLQIVEC